MGQVQGGPLVSGKAPRVVEEPLGTAGKIDAAEQDDDVEGGVEGNRGILPPQGKGRLVLGLRRGLRPRPGVPSGGEGRPRAVVVLPGVREGLEAVSSAEEERVSVSCVVDDRGSGPCGRRQSRVQPGPRVVGVPPRVVEVILPVVPAEQHHVVIGGLVGHRRARPRRWGIPRAERGPRTVQILPCVVEVRRSVPTSERHRVPVRGVPGDRHQRPAARLRGPLPVFPQVGGVRGRGRRVALARKTGPRNRAVQRDASGGAAAERERALRALERVPAEQVGKVGRGHTQRGLGPRTSLEPAPDRPQEEDDDDAKGHGDRCRLGASAAPMTPPGQVHPFAVYPPTRRRCGPRNHRGGRGSTLYKPSSKGRLGFGNCDKRPHRAGWWRWTLGDRSRPRSFGPDACPFLGLS